MKKSEKKMLDILAFLDSYANNYGYSPSYREIAKNVGLKSTNSVKAYLDILEQRSLIKRQPTKYRTIEISGKQKNNTIELPIVGQVAAGAPILAEQNIEDTFSISSSFFGIPAKSHQSLFALKVKGQSMIDKGIFDGDIVISVMQNTARNGEIVVAMIDGNATVKTFYKEPTFVRLQPANNAYRPIFADDLTILGKVVGVIRRI